ncbi:5-formaminoimidazole-4-carboxamide-1-(beta)-D-ribofuranosyl 5'-monophosphate synthetase [Candidatus Micrarchaeota archaeon CG08_land_8_20_14_0_20_49_17]|nr:MAG: hypothetical protein AUJ13_04615 [Candidatus Micrarchaeota archaeon CG1_02_49_24]PIU09309.1 MAG: 5-formaminoimidazole-4-carboxamide-1-(beta)-D-ribofuranosyl 5'-monophosphate synthetase [Candidatus Micrarchaeota archaeon CG08_land_8_20_14_0_20_49_17]PIU81438.1 MAG: 5-formaminoimidazole-4-carboxamide-1-(beta)-D-ribofuranosyl 5'-monophosphate synthetase [Candidatus Micrarchaeota archaeon CG06_land_8_20_14_3_00_50_6]
MITKEEIDYTLESYKGNVTIATVCSHSALQIFYGARQEGFKTIGIVTPKRRELYESFKHAKPDIFIEVDDPSIIPEQELLEHNAILVPHGSIVAYNKDSLLDMHVPIMGNRKSLLWESSRESMFKWIEHAGLERPKILKPDEIDRPCIVKFSGARGGMGYQVVNSPAEFYEKFAVGGKVPEGLLIQEFLIGIRVYPHFFYSPITADGYHAHKGSVELIGFDRRVESNIDESYRCRSIGIDIKPSFTVIGNEPITVRESLLGEVFEMAKKIVVSADELFGGIPGPFSFETVCDENMQFYVFEISSRIVAGTNVYAKGSMYTMFNHGVPISMGQRIAKEIKHAIKENRLSEIIF